MRQRSESFIPGFQDTKLFYQDWMPKHPKKLIFFTHGQGEHSDCYSRLIEGLDTNEVGFIGWDLRGHGKSEGVRGFVENFNDYLLDFEIMYSHLKSSPKYQNLPTYFLGHSMGGLIVVNSVLSQRRFEYKGLILSSPMFGISVPVPAYKDIAAKILKNIFPKLTLHNELTYDMLTKDPAVVKEYEKDLLRHNKISAGTYLGSLDAMRFALERAPDLKGPILVQIPEQDPVVSSPATQIFFDKIADQQKTLKTYKDRRHEIYNDTAREEVFMDVKDFLSAKS